MDFRDAPEEAAFRKEVREFLAEEASAGFGATSGDPAHEDTRGGIDRYGFHKEWMKKLAARGWIAPAWPEEYGGAGLTVMQQFVFNEEMARARAPRPGGVGVNYTGPTIILHGTEEQKREHLPGILAGDVVWCQGFSEPESGSDLASLQTRAVKDGDDYVVSGQKIWTSGAQLAHRMILLARTDAEAPKHKGISYFLLDMQSPGIEIAPLVNMADRPGFNQVFFDNVRVPRKDLLGEENRGWYYATTTLDFERSSIGGATDQKNQVEDLAEFVRTAEDGRAARHPSVRLSLAERAIEAEAATLLCYKVITLQARGLVPNHEASAAKLYSSELGQRVANVALQLAGMYGQLDRDSARGADEGPNRRVPLRGRLMRGYLWSPALTVAGGTSEIQRNIIAIRGLGLPRG